MFKKCFVPKGYVTSILDDAKIYSSHAKKPNVDADDVRLAIQCRADQSFTSPPPRDVSKLLFEVHFTYNFLTVVLIRNFFFLVFTGYCKAEKSNPFTTD